MRVCYAPNLRFPEFHGEWEEYRIEDITENISSGRCKSHSSNGKYNLYGSTGIIGKTDEACYEGNLVLIARVGANAGSLQIINEPCGITDNTLIIKPKEVDAQYIYYFLQHFNLNRLIFGSGQPLITGGMLKKVKVSLGTIQEQNKLTLLLSLLDERIATQNKAIDKLQSLIKGIRQSIFSNITDGNKSTIGQHLIEYNEKNADSRLKPVSIGRYGIRLRDEIYSRELSDDYSKNKVIRKNTLTIGMGSTQIDIGILSENKVYCVSPAYTTFSIIGVNTNYFQEYLTYLNPQLSNLYMVTGARQGKSVNKEEFLHHKIIIHSDDYQRKIADEFRILNNCLSVEKEFLRAILKQKQYLLRQMFI